MCKDAGTTNAKKVSLLLMAIMDDAEVKTLTATICKPGDTVHGINLVTQAKLLLTKGVL
jgi:hypothetical protein